MRACEILYSILQNEIIVRFLGTDLVNLPSQFWFARYASRNWRTNNIEMGERKGGGGGVKEIISLVVKCFSVTAERLSYHYR